MQEKNCLGLEEVVYVALPSGSITCIGPPPWALGLLVNQELYRRLSAQAMVRSHGVVGQQPIRQFPVEGGQVVKEQVLMIIHERFLDRADEAFHVGIHFGGAGVRPPVGDASFLQAVLEVPQEFRAIVREHVAWGGGQQVAEGARAST